MRSDPDFGPILSRLLEVEEAARRRDPTPAPGTTCCLLRTTAVGGYTYPTAASSTFPVRRVKAGGAESEGAAVELTVVGPTFYAKNTGVGVPPVGTDHLGALVDSRWLFHYDDAP